MKHTTIALFVPHRGCPHQCSFCNQKSISGQLEKITADDVHSAVFDAQKNQQLKNAQIAFFGGSFTAIEKEYMLELLSAANEHIDGEKITGIRISTRPDAVNAEICLALKQHKVVAVELGAQSMSDDVLSQNQRGHTAADVEKALALLKKYGFETGLQMMTGLYGSNAKESISTAQKIILLKPDTIRIYPTIVIENTPLAQLFYSGEYTPQTLDEAVELCSKLILMFSKAKIKIIRVGLHSGGGVDDGYIAGAYHPAFRELCDSRIYFNLIKDQLGENKSPTVFVANGAISQAIGQKRENLNKLLALGYDCKIIQSKEVEKYQVLIKE